MRVNVDKLALTSKLPKHVLYTLQLIFVMERYDDDR